MISLTASDSGNAINFTRLIETGVESCSSQEAFIGSDVEAKFSLVVGRAGF